MRRNARIAVAAAVAAILLSGLAVSVLTEAHWDGRVTVSFELTVRDAVSDRPVAGAAVRLLEGTHAFWAFAKTDPPPEARAETVAESEGRASLNAEVRAHGTFNAFRMTGFATPIGLAIETEAPGYERKLIPVEELAPNPKRLYKERVVKATIRLVPLKVTATQSERVAP